jgi:hypothetical protein
MQMVIIGKTGECEMCELKSGIAEFVGNDSTGTPLYVGSDVTHNEKAGLLGAVGVITKGGESYKGEAAVVATWPNRPWGFMSRLSKLTAVKKVQSVAEFGYAVGQQVYQKKHKLVLEITSGEVGSYRDEPCCYTNGGRPTRFSQIEPYVGQDQQAAAPTPTQVIPPFQPPMSEGIFGGYKFSEVPFADDSRDLELTFKVGDTPVTVHIQIG